MADIFNIPGSDYSGLSTYSPNYAPNSSYWDTLSQVNPRPANMPRQTDADTSADVGMGAGASGIAGPGSGGAVANALGNMASNMAAGYAKGMAFSALGITPLGALALALSWGAFQNTPLGTQITQSINNTFNPVDDTILDSKDARSFNAPAVDNSILDSKDALNQSNIASTESGLTVGSDGAFGGLGGGGSAGGNAGVGGIGGLGGDAVGGSV